VTKGRLPFLPPGFRFETRNAFAVGLVARAGMFSAMLMGLRTTLLCLPEGQLAAAALSIVLFTVLAYGLRRLHLAAAAVLLITGPIFLWSQDLDFAHIFIVFAVPVAPYFAWRLRGESEETRKRLLGI
jgi:hypothetical protein